MRKSRAGGHQFLRTPAACRVTGFALGGDGTGLVEAPSKEERVRPIRGDVVCYEIEKRRFQTHKKAFLC